MKPLRQGLARAPSDGLVDSTELDHALAPLAQAPLELARACLRVSAESECPKQLFVPSAGRYAQENDPESPAGKAAPHFASELG